MNTITFSDYEASTTGHSSLSSGRGYNVEIKKEGSQWSVWACAERTDNPRDEWTLSHIRISAPKDQYPSVIDIGRFLIDVDTYIDALMNKLIPSHKNA